MKSQQHTFRTPPDLSHFGRDGPRTDKIDPRYIRSIFAGWRRHWGACLRPECRGAHCAYSMKHPIVWVVVDIGRDAADRDADIKGHVCATRVTV